jgi:hypothetical protein
VEITFKQNNKKNNKKTNKQTMLKLRASQLDNSHSHRAGLTGAWEPWRQWSHGANGALAHQTFGPMAPT